jgi:hypothetical protein
VIEKIFCQSNEKILNLQSKFFGITENKRRAGRVVECGGLENRYIFTGIRGSNPWLSAINET